MLIQHRGSPGLHHGENFSVGLVDHLGAPGEHSGGSARGREESGELGRVDRRTQRQRRTQAGEYTAAKHQNGLITALSPEEKPAGQAEKMIYFMCVNYLLHTKYTSFLINVCGRLTRKILIIPMLYNILFCFQNQDIITELHIFRLSEKMRQACSDEILCREAGPEGGYFIP